MHTRPIQITASAPALVIFDCDGVLVDSERMQVEIEVAYLAELGLDLGHDEVVRRFMGRSERDMMADVRALLGRPLPDGWHGRLKAAIRHALDTRLTAVPGAPEAIAAVHAAGLQTCVASSGSHERIANSLRTTGLAPLLGERVFSALDVERGKPAPDLFVHAAAAMGVEPAACVVVEDSPYGVAGALAAGMAVIGLDTGMLPPAALGCAHARVSRMADLPAAVERLARGQ